VADVQILRPSASAVPSSYTLPDAAELRLKAVYAEFDDAGAAGDWLPCVTILSDSGDVIGRAVDQDVLVTAGDDADVTWFPRVRRRRAGATTETRCKLLGSGTGTDTITLTLSSDIPADGVLQVVLMQATIGNALDTASEPSNVVDSNAVAGWVWPATLTNQPLIGPIRETIAGSGPATTSQLLSVVRRCTAADLSAGDTITVTYSTASPALFHTCGLIIWQRAFFETIRQFGFFMYANGDDHPGAGAPLNRLSWTDDFGAPFTAPDKDALSIIGLGAYPAVAGAQAFNGTFIGEEASGQISVAAFCYPTEVGDDFDPGGTWPSNAIQLVGNYQTVYPRTFSSAI
jgi:hypothetical protein